MSDNEEEEIEPYFGPDNTTESEFYYAIILISFGDIFCTNSAKITDAARFKHTYPRGVYFPWSLIELLETF